MKTLNLTFTDAEFRKLRKAKYFSAYPKSWERFVLYTCTKGYSVVKGGKDE